MNKKQFFSTLVLFFIMLLFGFLLYKRLFRRVEPELYQTRKPGRHTISRIIKSTGYLEVKDTMKIGSLVPGVVDKMFVEENEFVKKGDVIALIDDGKGDTDVRATKAQWDAAKAKYAYDQKHYERQKDLYANSYLSQDDFEKATAEYENSKQQVLYRKGLYDKALLVYNNKTIHVPDNGVVIKKDSSEGETVTLASPATILYTIAKDITLMEAKLEVDEASIGEVKDGMHAEMKFDTYPYKIFSGEISTISKAPKKENGAIVYLATVPLCNKERLFRPGMTVNAEIVVAKEREALVLPTHILKINKHMLEEIAQLKDFEYKPMTREEKKKLKMSGRYQMVWVKEDSAFIEKPVKVGLFNDAYVEVVDGLNGDEDIIIDTIEPDAMKEFFSKFFGKGLG